MNPITDRQERDGPLTVPFPREGSMFMGSGVRHLGRAVCCGLAALGLTACSGDEEPDPVATTVSIGETSGIPGAAEFDADGDGFYSADELERAINATFAQYAWPAGLAIRPEHLIKEIPENDGPIGHRFEAGMQHTLLWSWQSCAWYMEWLDAYRSGDTEREREALDVMTTVLPESPILDPSTSDFMRQIAQQASLGDPSLVQQDVNANCSYLSLDALRTTTEPFMATPVAIPAAHRETSVA